jgi:hypothetical protein
VVSTEVDQAKKLKRRFVRKWWRRIAAVTGVIIGVGGTIAGITGHLTSIFTEGKKFFSDAEPTVKVAVRDARITDVDIDLDDRSRLVATMYYVVDKEGDPELSCRLEFLFVNGAVWFTPYMDNRVTLQKGTGSREYFSKELFYPGNLRKSTKMRVVCRGSTSPWAALEFSPSASRSADGLQKSVPK